MSSKRSRGVLTGWAAVVLALAVPTVVLTQGEVAARMTGDPVIAAAGDISCDPQSPAYHDGLGTPTDCRQKYTANLLDGASAVLPLGDLQYACGGLAAYQQAYDPTWGRFKAISHPVPGNHEYLTSGGTDCSANAAGYFGYFGSAAGEPGKGYYSYDIGPWHVVALNSECAQIGGCFVGSPEERWLRADLAAHPATCTLAYLHRPRFASSAEGGDTTFTAIWQALYDARADVLLAGHQHWYERFAPQDSAGRADANGIRQFVVGTGGASYVVPAAPRAANSEALLSGASAFGVLKLTLHATSYDWAFVTENGTSTDTGTQACHDGGSRGDTIAPITSVTCRQRACSRPWYRRPPVAVRLAGTDIGWGVAATYYTTDGSTPTAGSRRYASALALRRSTLLRYYSVDLAGNAEAVGSTLVRIDAAAPKVSVRSLSDQDVLPAGRRVRLKAKAVDLGTRQGAPSGVARVRFYVDGELVGSDRSAPYAVSWRPGARLRGPHRLRVVAVDVAHNAAASAAVRFTVG